jgi:hypothetical protein
MKASREALRAQSEQYEAQLKGLKSFIKELTDKTAEHGTEREHFETDLIEAENNIKYYEDAIARIRDEMDNSAQAGSSPTETDTILPRTTKQGIGSFIFSSIGFVAGALLGSRLKSRSDGQDKQEKSNADNRST